MKLEHLAIGARFEYEGITYVKTGPITAASEQGGQRLIPRYAILRPLDLPEPEPRANFRGRLDKPAVMAALAAFYETCQTLVEPSRQDELAAARQRFIETLK